MQFETTVSPVRRPPSHRPVAAERPRGPGRAVRLHSAVALLSALALLLLGAPPTLSAQSEAGSIVGRISPTHDHEMAQARARIADLGLQAEIAGDGTFRFESVRPGSYVVEVRVPTLGSAAQRVVVRPGEETEVEIEITAGSHFEELVVTATGDAREALELANPVSSLSGEELLERSEATLGETLAAEPGISSSFFGQGASRPIIRGLAGDRVRVLEDGIGSGDASDVSVDHAVTNDPLQAEKIEVLRGPATLLYGSSAIGGAVNVIDERIPSTRATSAVGGTVDLRGGSVSDERVGSVTLNGGGGDWAWHANVLARETDDYEIPGFARDEHGEEHEEHSDEEHGDDEHGDEGDDHEEEENSFGFVPNSDLETQGARVGVNRFFGDSGYLGVAASGFDTEYGIPGGAHEHAEDDEHGEDEEHDDHGDEHGDEEEHGEENIRVDMEQRRIDLRGLVRRDFGIFQAVKTRIGANEYEHAELEGDEVGTRFFNDYLEGRVELVQRQRGRSSGSVGLQYSDRDLESVGAEAFVPKSAAERWAAFTLQEIEAGPVTWQLGARYETQDSDAVGFGSVDHDGLSASAGLVWRTSDTWSVAGSLSRSVKLPAPEELFADGPHVATQAFEVGNPDLIEEKGLGLDLSLRRTAGRVTGELTLFRQEFDDFIYQAFTGAEEDGLPVVLFSQEDATFTGAELAARIELLDRDGHHLHFEAVGDTVEADLDTGGNLPRIPPMTLGGGLHYHSERWKAMAEVRWVDDQDEVAVNETPTDGHTFVNASVGYRIIFGGRIVDLLLRGRNLTDEEARVHTSFLKEFAPLPGRDVSLSARFWF